MKMMAVTGAIMMCASAFGAVMPQLPEPVSRSHDDGEYFGWERTLPPPYDDFSENGLIAAEELAEKLVTNYDF